jgi:hypothetical protein
MLKTLLCDIGAVEIDNVRSLAAVDVTYLNTRFTPVVMLADSSPER